MLELHFSFRNYQHIEDYIRMKISISSHRLKDETHFEEKPLQETFTTR